jgi:hypothetical protein
MFDVVVVEGDLEISIACALLRACGMAFPEETVLNKRGIENFWSALPRLNEAARHKSIFALADLEQHPCAPKLIADRLGSKRHTNLVLRLSVRMSESWLLADRAEIAKFLGVPHAAIPSDPEALPNPKQTLVNIARRSRLRRIRDSIVPEGNSLRLVGIDYMQTLSRFAANHWDPERASGNSSSLKKALQRLREHAARVRGGG